MPCQQHKAATTETFRSKKLEETVQKVATNTIGYTRKRANKEWLDEECARVNQEKNAARDRAIQIKSEESRILNN
jgi:hypothetical protein